MSERIHGLAQLLPDKSSLDDYTLEELQHAAKRYPFFAPVQFLLLQKMKEASLPEAAAQLQKATLYYNDPLLFDYFLSPDRFDTEEKVSDPVRAADTTVNEAATVADEPVLDTQQNVHFPVKDGEIATPDDSSKTGVAAAPELPGNEKTEEAALPTSLPELETATQPDRIETVEPVVLPTEGLQPFLPDNAGPVAAESVTNAADNALAIQPEASTAATESPMAGSVEAPTAGNGVIDAPLPQSEEVETTPVVNQPQKAAPVQEPLAFEPFHTVDYFASQGIRITADELPKDKLSKQLRSFTEWLRIMKRLPAAEVAQSPETVAEKSVESLASHSVQGSDVVTEAMAEVWARQGNRQKAIETYNKLSLQNPSKRTYFAAKIENLS